MTHSNNKVFDKEKYKFGKKICCIRNGQTGIVRFLTCDECKKNQIDLSSLYHYICVDYGDMDNDTDIEIYDFETYYSFIAYGEIFEY